MELFWSKIHQKGIDPRLIALAREAEAEAEGEFRLAEDMAKANQLKVLLAFQETGVTEYHLKDGTGYGYNDPGREGLEEVYARAFEAEAALVRAQIVSGTHAISLGLTALLKPGDELLSAVGRPYDTLARIIGVDGNRRSLVGQGIGYREARLDNNGRPDFQSIAENITERTRVVLIQRSRGYNWRQSLSVNAIGEMISFIKKIKPEVLCFVDNCYGEFVEEAEPTGVGADVMAGSLIKNPGAGLAPSGGYLAGRKEVILEVGDRLIAPGMGNKVSTNLGIGHLLYQGFFMAPAVVGEALKGAIFAAHLFSRLGYETSPAPGAARSDIVQAIKIGSSSGIQAFCRGIQCASPVDSRAVPEPGQLPGYDDPVIMAAGTFVQGSSIELSADAPMRPPYIVYVQGGLSYPHALCGLLSAAQEMQKKGLINWQASR